VVASGRVPGLTSLTGLPRRRESVSDYAAAGSAVMGWRLAEEVAWARPERPGKEWWTLLDIAQDARDETRQGMPGMEYLTLRGKCAERTIYRRLEALESAGLVKVVRRAAPGIRAVYEVGPLLRLPRTPDSNSDTRTPDNIAVRRSGATPDSLGATPDNIAGRRTPDTITVTPPVKDLPVTTAPVTTGGPVVAPSVEVSPPGVRGGRPRIEFAGCPECGTALDPDGFCFICNAIRRTAGGR
jgi:hypothetical protein